MITIITLVIYFIFSVLLFPLLLTKSKLVGGALAFTIGLNTIPFLFVSELGMGDTRLLRIPFTYIPMISCGMALFLLNRGKIDKRDQDVLFSGWLFITYVIIVGIFKGFSWDALQYLCMWIFNIMLYLTTARFFSRLKSPVIDRSLIWIIRILILCSILGIARFLWGMSPDSNFMPMFNRNGTIFIVVALSPLLFFLKERKYIKQMGFWVALSIIALSLLMMDSRSGILGFGMVALLYFGTRFKYQKNTVIVFIIIVISLILSPIGQKMLQRFEDLPTAFQVLREEQSEGSTELFMDIDRVMLIKGAIEIIKNEFWFGSGVGLENYQQAFMKHFDYYRQTKPHNFYLWSLAEYGVIGFTLLMALLSMIYKRLPPLRSDCGAFLISFLGIAFLMLLNEYITLPELWFITGMLVGIYRQMNGIKFDTKLAYNHNKQGSAVLNL